MQADSIVVELQFDNGISGYGESAPRPYVTGETRSSVIDAIMDHFADILFSREINSLADAENTLNILEKGCLDRNFTLFNSALGAIDIALLDALGKFQGLPLYNYLGAVDGNKISRSLSIPFLDDETLKTLYPRIEELELDSVKVLLGDDETDNYERLRLIRSLLGDKKEIRIEANGKWSLEQALANIEKLKRFNISGVEQPVAKTDIEGLQTIREKTGILVIADESMCSLSDAKYLIDMGACDIINIKISKCGGLLRSKQIRDFAESRDVRCQIGAHVGETDILGRAGQYFAMTTSDLFCFEGLSHLLFENSWKDRLRRTDSFINPGLGAELTNQTLKPICSLESKNA